MVDTMPRLDVMVWPRRWNPARAIRAVLLLLCLVFAAAGAGALEITDDRGVRVTVAVAPARIVTVLPSLTEMVCQLGHCQRLVGVDRYSNFPESVRQLPRVGGGLDPSVEAIVALRPDLVLLAASSPVAARLESLGLVVLAFEPKRYADVRRVLDQLGRVLDAGPQAQHAWNAIESGVAAAAQSLPPSARGTRVYFEVNAAPYAAGESSFIGETLQRLGLRNIVPAQLGAFPRINPEFVVRADPDLIMVGDASFVGMLQRPGWSRMRAIAEKRVCVFDPAQADVMVRAGPRIAEAAHAMARCVTSHRP
jgi:iron complex transport system substrate-binding protein